MPSGGAALLRLLFQAEADWRRKHAAAGAEGRVSRRKPVHRMAVAPASVCLFVAALGGRPLCLGPLPGLAPAAPSVGQQPSWYSPSGDTVRWHPRGWGILTNYGITLVPGERHPKVAAELLDRRSGGERRDDMFGGADWALDGKHVVVSSLRWDYVTYERQRLFVVGIGDGVRRLVSGPGFPALAGDPIVEPRRGRIAFIGPDGTYVTDEHGSKPRRLIRSDGPVCAARWSPKGRWLLTTVRREPGSRKATEIVDVDTGKSIPLPVLRNGEPVAAVYASWSPAGDRLAYSSYGPPEQPHGLSVYRLATRTVLTAVPTAKDEYVRYVAWSPDARQLAYVSDHSGLVVVDVRSGRSRLLVRRNDTAIGSLAWSPDGRWIAYLAGGREGVRLVRVRTSGKAVVQRL